MTTVQQQHGNIIVDKIYNEGINVTRKRENVQEVTYLTDTQFDTSQPSPVDLVTDLELQMFITKKRNYVFNSVMGNIKPERIIGYCLPNADIEVKDKIISEANYQVSSVENYKVGTIIVFKQVELERDV